MNDWPRELERCASSSEYSASIETPFAASVASRVPSTSLTYAAWRILEALLAVGRVGLEFFRVVVDKGVKTLVVEQGLQHRAQSRSLLLRHRQLLDERRRVLGDATLNGMPSLTPAGTATSKEPPPASATEIVVPSAAPAGQTTSSVGIAVTRRASRAAFARHNTRCAARVDQGARLARELERGAGVTARRARMAARPRARRRFPWREDGRCGGATVAPDGSRPAICNPWQPGGLTCCLDTGALRAERAPGCVEHKLQQPWRRDGTCGPDIRAIDGSLPSICNPLDPYNNTCCSDQGGAAARRTTAAAATACSTARCRVPRRRRAVQDPYSGACYPRTVVVPRRHL